MRIRTQLLALLTILAGSSAVFVSNAGGPAHAETESRIIEHKFEVVLPGPDGPEFGLITMYAVDDGADLEQRLADGEAAMLARMPGAVRADGAGVRAAFKLFATPVRWPVPAASWLYNPTDSTSAMPAAAAQEAITLGADGWDNAGGSGFQFGYLGETDAPTGCNGVPTGIPKDGKNVVAWGHIVGGFLGYSCHWRSASLVEDTPYFEMTEFDIIFEPNFAYTGTKLRALALHEFGHSLGLDHTETAQCPGRAMCGGEDALTFISPREDDMNGVIALYGIASPAPTVPPGPRPYRAYGPAVARD